MVKELTSAQRGAETRKKNKAAKEKAEEAKKAEQSDSDTDDHGVSGGTDDGITSSPEKEHRTPEVETPVEESTDENVTEDSPWHKIESLSDSKLTVEGANIQVRRRQMMMMRFVINGKITGQVEIIERVRYNEHNGSIEAY